MDKLLGMPLELQIVLVAGYLSFAITTNGRNQKNETEIVILKVLAFGLVARLTSVLGLVLLERCKILTSGNVSNTESFVVVGVATVTIGILFGMFWRGYGNRWSSAIMAWLGIYADDHEASVLSSLMNTKAKWNVVHLHLEDERVLVADYSKFDPTLLPMNGVTLNNDGIALYLTGSYTKSGRHKKYDPIIDNRGHMLTFVPMDRIKQIDVTWI